MLISMAASDIILDGKSCAAAYHSIHLSSLPALILTLPWYPVWKLQMTLRRKLSVCAVFLLGGFVVAAGIVRFVYLLQATKKIASNLDYTCGFS